jgi:hypothetical protein
VIFQTSLRWRETIYSGVCNLTKRLKAPQVAKFFVDKAALLLYRKSGFQFNGPERVDLEDSPETRAIDLTIGYPS